MLEATGLEEGVCGNGGRTSVGRPWRGRAGARDVRAARVVLEVREEQEMRSNMIAVRTSEGDGTSEVGES